MPELSIVVLHFNRWDLTKDCLASIDAQDIPCTYEKVLVDNGSTEPPYPIPPIPPTGWRVQRYADNRGHIVGQNRCFESAQGQWVLFVANDVRLYRQCIKGLWSLRGEGLFPSAVGQFQPVLYRPDGAIDQCGMDWKWPGYGISRTTFRGNQVPITPSSCYLMKRSVWKEIGGFDKQLLTSHEDVDFGIRLQRANYWNLCQYSSKATHLMNATLRHAPTHTRAAFHRDRVYVIRKHYRGLDRWLRLLVVNFLDAIRGALG